MRRTKQSKMSAEGGRYNLRRKPATQAAEAVSPPRASAEAAGAERHSPSERRTPHSEQRTPHPEQRGSRGRRAERRERDLAHDSSDSSEEDRTPSALKKHRKDAYLYAIGERLCKVPSCNLRLGNPGLWNPWGWAFLARLNKWKPIDVREHGVITGVGEAFSRHASRLYGERKKHMQDVLVKQFVTIVNLVHLTKDFGTEDALAVLEPAVEASTSAFEVLQDSLVGELLSQDVVELERRRRRGEEAGLPSRLFSAKNRNK